MERKLLYGEFFFVHVYVAHCVIFLLLVER